MRTFLDIYGFNHPQEAAEIKAFRQKRGSEACPVTLPKDLSGYGFPAGCPSRRGAVSTTMDGKPPSPACWRRAAQYIGSLPSHRPCVGYYGAECSPSIAAHPEGSTNRLVSRETGGGPHQNLIKVGTSRTPPGRAQPTRRQLGRVPARCSSRLAVHQVHRVVQLHGAMLSARGGRSRSAGNDGARLMWLSRQIRPATSGTGGRPDRPLSCPRPPIELRHHLVVQFRGGSLQDAASFDGVERRLPYTRHLAYRGRSARRPGSGRPEKARW